MSGPEDRPPAGRRARGGLAMIFRAAREWIMLGVFVLAVALLAVFAGGAWLASLPRRNIGRRRR
jgi:hypothetical protein